MKDEEAHPPLTTVPTWPKVAPSLDLSARDYVIFSIGNRAAAVVEQWCDQLEAASIAVRVTDLGPLVEMTQIATSATIGLSGAMVGTRIAIVGEEAAVLHLRALAVDLGFLAEEVTVHATELDQVYVHCIHCTTRTLVAGRPGTVMTCPGCGVVIEIYPHVSWGYGCYLGSDHSARELRRVEKRPVREVTVECE